MTTDATHDVIPELRVRRLVVEEELVVVDRAGRVAGTWRAHEHGAELVLRDTSDDEVVPAFVSISAGNDDAEGAAAVNLVISEGGEWMEIDAHDVGRR